MKTQDLKHLNHQAIRADANSLEIDFINFFDSIFIENYFRIDSYDLRKCIKYHKRFFDDINPEANNLYNELLLFCNKKYYYENFSKNEFRLLINKVRHFYYLCSVYIEMDVIEDIIDSKMGIDEEAENYQYILEFN